MKVFSAFLALVTLFFASAPLHADQVNLTLDGNTIVGTPIANGYNFTYLNTTAGVFSQGNLLNSSTTLFTATYVNALGSLGVFNFTDVCATVTVLGPAVPCQSLALSFTNLTLGDASIIAAVGAAVDVNAGVGTINVGGLNLVPEGFNLAGASIAGGSGQINFTPPSGPSDPGNGGGSNTSPVPEPSSLSLMATGLLGAAGAIRRKFKA
ncbi:MAG: PEP-CTERM sorting domain-containing protein [Edaphobacter sp.]